MNDPILANYIATAAVSGGAVLTGKIIFDWLKNRSSNGAKGLNSSECFKWKTGVDTNLATYESKIKDHEKRLDKGSSDFEGIKKDISGINVSMAVFAEKLEKEGV